MAVLLHTRLESHPVGTTNVGGVINGNWEQLELILNPVHDDHDYTGLTADMGNVVRDCVFRDEPEILSGTTPAIEFDKEPHKRLVGIAATTTFTFSGRGNGKFVFLHLRAASTTQTLNWPGTGDVKWAGGSAPGSVTSAADLIVKLWCFGDSGDEDRVYGEFLSYS